MFILAQFNVIHKTLFWVFNPFEQEVRVIENMAVAFMEAVECGSSSVNDKATDTCRKSPEYLVTVFLEGSEHLTELQLWLMRSKPKAHWMQNLLNFPTKVSKSCFLPVTILNRNGWIVFKKLKMVNCQLLTQDGRGQRVTDRLIDWLDRVLRRIGNDWSQQVT